MTSPAMRRHPDRLLSEQELAALGDMVERLVLVETCSILHGTRTQDAGGGYTTVWTERASVACALLDGGGPTEAIMAAQPLGTIVKLLLLPRGTVISPAERVRVGGALTYEVIGPYDPTTYETVRRVLVKYLSSNPP